MSISRTFRSTCLSSRFPTTAIFSHEVLPLEATDGRVRMATSDPFDLEAPMN
ncbi:MAG: hypothetical protein R3B91_15395 [Planctomycetaceae bacterium]